MLTLSWLRYYKGTCTSLSLNTMFIMSLPKARYLCCVSGSRNIFDLYIYPPAIFLLFPFSTTIMFIFDFLFLKWIFGTSIALYVVYHAYWELTVGTSRRRMMKAYGCKPITWSSNGFFGLGQYREFMKAWKTHAILDCLHRQIERHGSTSKSRVLHEELIITVDPENLKTIMATKFKDWNLPDLRKKALRPLLGDGIFTTDGTAWQHSRDLLRPNFVRSQVGNLNKLEVHVSHFLQAIPRDRSTVDLQELFFRLTLDSATEFLFGESTYCLAPGTSKESNARFASAFNRCQEHVGEGPKNVLLSILPFISRGSQHQRDLDFVHLFVDRYVRLGFEYQKCHGLEKAEDERYIFLHELVRSTQDPIQIRSELLNILLAGRDTTASLLSNTLFMLAKKPTIWAKLRREVENLGGARPTYQQIKDLKYLKAVLNESKKEVILSASLIDITQLFVFSR